MKLIFLVLGIAFSSISVMAQNVSKSPSVSIGLQGSNNVSGPNFGISGSVNMIWPSTQSAGSIPDNWVASFKLSQLKRGYGNFLSAFDGNEYGNISAASLMGGYRLGLTAPSYFHKPFEQPTAGLYIEGLTGVSFVGTKNIHPTFDVNLGYYITRHFDLNTSAQWTQEYGKNLWILGAGGTFTF